MQFRSRALWFAIAAANASCAAQPSSPAELHDTVGTSRAAQTHEAPANSTIAKAAQVPSPREELAQYLRAHMPSGGVVLDDSDAPRVMHTIAPGDTHASLAAAYLELTSIYNERDLQKVLKKGIPILRAGESVQIPNIIARAPKADPKDDRLGWPEDRALRALFLTGPYAQLKWTVVLDKMAQRDLNAVVLDAKDYMGTVNYPTKAKLAMETGAAKKASIPNLARAIRFAHDRGIRVILRIPCFHDPIADKKAKDARLSIRHASGTVALHIDWIDPTNTEAQDYAIDLARESIEAGADEINLDYVRFPVHLGQKTERLPNPKDRSAIIANFVRRVHAVTKPAGVMLSLDLFGVTATGSRDDIEKLGQDIAVVGKEADVIMPMVYPSHYDKGYNGWSSPGDHPEIVGIGTKAAVKQLKQAKALTIVRSWLQAFPWRVTTYGARYVVSEAKSAEANGSVGWAMWSPGCEYSAVWAGFPPRSSHGNVAKTTWSMTTSTSP
jgi:hypothetical protein